MQVRSGFGSRVPGPEAWGWALGDLGTDWGLTSRAHRGEASVPSLALVSPQEAESRPRCRRLQLKDMIPTEMQRLTKYPLLLQSIGQNTGTTACTIPLGSATLP